jgi:hypothetical protein
MARRTRTDRFIFERGGDFGVIEQIQEFHGDGWGAGGEAYDVDDSQYNAEYVRTNGRKPTQNEIDNIEYGEPGWQLVCVEEDCLDNDTAEVVIYVPHDEDLMIGLDALNNDRETITGHYWDTLREHLGRISGLSYEISTNRLNHSSRFANDCDGWDLLTELQKQQIEEARDLAFASADCFAKELDSQEA